MPYFLKPTVDAWFASDGLQFRTVRYPDGYFMPRHDHDTGCLVFILKGAIQGDWRRQSVLTTPSTLTFLPAGELHANRFHDIVETFDVVLSSAWIERIRQYSPVIDAPATYPNGPLAWVAMRLYREFLRRDDLTPLMLEGLTLELITLMGRCDATEAVEREAPRWLKQARDFLHAHVNEGLSLGVIAAAVGTHPSHLTRAFKQHYHCTVGDYVRRQRVEYARHRLSTSDIPLAQIAREAGFSDQAHFSRIFKNLTGMTPSQFQKAAGCAERKQNLLI
jgi:AraC family transcriptional regulator